MSINGKTPDEQLAYAIRNEAHPLIGAKSDLDPLLDMVGERPIVLMGEATHGSYEFYRTRFEISKRLIEEKGFAAIAIEADWPDALEVNRFIHRRDLDSEVAGALEHFRRFPMWMWRNTEFLKMVEWLWLHNHKEVTANRVSIYGIDLYSLYTSMQEVIRYLENEDSEAAERARQLYSCFDHYSQDPVRYGRFVRVGAQPSCEQSATQAARLLFERRAQEQLGRPSALASNFAAADELFFAQQNAELVKNAESYYRNIFSPTVNTWNVRDRHMADTVDNVLKQLAEMKRPQKIIIWAHNSHIGDDRATDMGRRGQWNIGQLLRERHPDQTFHLGFTTYDGTVTAATEWDHPPELKTILPALPESFEALFHKVGVNNFFLPLVGSPLRADLNETRLERAIGVIYSPETERQSHYFEAELADQFDAVMHFDRTREVEPLDRLPTRELYRPSDIQL